MASRSPTLRVRARGPLACFTRPELKVERMSYPVMTPSAARGLLEAVLWKPALTWYVDRISVLSPIVFTAFRRNEVNTKAVVPPKATVDAGGELDHYFADEDRAQRNTVALRDVDYVIEGHFTLTGRAGPGDNVTKFVEMFNRRVERGQHFHQPYFGCREFIAELLPVVADLTPIPDSRDLGLMLLGVRYGARENTAHFFDAKLDHGVLEIPPFEPGEPSAPRSEGTLQATLGFETSLTVPKGGGER